MLDYGIFFRAVRTTIFGGRLTNGQVDGMTRIVEYWQSDYPKMSADEFAYVLATIAWETDRKMVPVREAGGEAYLRRKKYYPWVGEGLVQVTWEANARKLGAKRPGDLMQWPIALHAAFFGMATGMFTGKKLADYIGNGRRDYLNARRIINGTDRAREVGAYALSFRAALIAAGERPAPVQEEAGATLADISEFKERLLYLFENDEDVRAAVIAIVFPEAEPTEEADPMDEPHEEFGGEEVYDDDPQITDAVTQEEWRG